MGYYLLCIMLPAMVLGGAAQMYLMSTYRKWKQQRNSLGKTGVETANAIMQNYGLRVQVIPIQQELGDHYNPSNQTVGMSPDIANVPSVAAMAVAAHEFGHVQQYAEGSGLIKARTALLPVAQIGSSAAYFLIFGGLVLNIMGLAYLGLLLFGAAVMFSILTLPVEFDASRRAMKMLEGMGFLQTREDRNGASAVLRAAALTYVAATAVAILNFAYYAMLVFGGSRD